MKEPLNPGDYYTDPREHPPHPQSVTENEAVGRPTPGVFPCYKEGSDFLFQVFKKLSSASADLQGAKRAMNELLELVDGAYEVVELYQPKCPAGEVWKADWLDKARKLVPQ